MSFARMGGSDALEQVELVLDRQEAAHVGIREQRLLHHELVAYARGWLRRHRTGTGELRRAEACEQPARFRRGRAHGITRRESRDV